MAKIITFGCRTNIYESELMSEILKDDDNTIVINTCAVTSEAERQCRQKIRQIRRQNPNAKIIAVGCAVQLNPDIYSSMREVDFILGNSEKVKSDFLQNCQKSFVNPVIQSKDIPLIMAFDTRKRALIQIQQGCNHKCTFCVVRLVRGKSQSIDREKVILLAQNLVKKGCIEITLTGIDLTSYSDNLPLLISELTQIDGLDRIRLGSVDPAGISDELINLFSNPKMMPYVHFSLQSGDDLILKRMGRRHRRKDINALIQKFRHVRPDIIFGADIITGFPTESDEAFQNTVDMIIENQIIHLHVFPFSPRPGTPSEKMPMTDVTIRKKRAQKLRQVGQGLMNDYLNQQIGLTDTVLIEKNKKGLSSHYTSVSVDDNVADDELVEVIITDRSENGLVGRIKKRIK